jgi:hypothetical protein
MHTLITTSSLSKQPLFYTRDSVAILLYLTLRSLLNFDIVKIVLPPYILVRQNYGRKLRSISGGHKLLVCHCITTGNTISLEQAEHWFIVARGRSGNKGRTEFDLQT